MYYVTLDGLTQLWVILLGVGIGDPWPSGKVSGLDGHEPRIFD